MIKKSLIAFHSLFHLYSHAFFSDYHYQRHLSPEPYVRTALESHNLEEFSLCLDGANKIKQNAQSMKHTLINGCMGIHPIGSQTHFMKFTDDFFLEEHAILPKKLYQRGFKKSQIVDKNLCQKKPQSADTFFDFTIQAIYNESVYQTCLQNKQRGSL